MIELLQSAKAGDEIDLGARRVAPFYLRDLRFDEPVTIRGGIFDCPDETMRCFRLDNCAGLVFDGAQFTGRDRTAGAVLVDRGTNIAFRRAGFSGLKHGLAHRGVDGFEVTDCRFSDMRVDAIRGGGSSRVLIARNVASDFFPVDTGGDGDHPDFIQFWPLAGYTANDDIVITDNFYRRGSGRPAQGIFVRGIYPDRPRFGRVIVRGNRIEGGLRNGISVSGAAAGEVADNIIVSQDDVISFLRVEEFGGTVNGNCARHFVGDVPLTSNRLGEPLAAGDPRTVKITLEPGQSLIVTTAAGLSPGAGHPLLEVID